MQPTHRDYLSSRATSSSYTVEELRQKFPTIRKVEPRQNNASANATFDRSTAEAKLPHDLMALIRGGAPEGTRSEEFHGAVAWLKRSHWTIDAIVSLMGDPPQGIAERYEDEGRLREEVERSFSKVEEPDSADDEIAKLAELNTLAYHKRRKGAARELDISVTALDKLVRQHRAQAEEDDEALPHWKVEPWSTPVDCADLLDGIKSVFCRYIVLPAGADDALALWTLHAWTMDAGDISPFLTLVSPTKQCGKSNTLTLLKYLTPRSETTSNISASALFRYIEDTRPTLLLDEGDSFIKDNEEMRGILNSGHTRSAAYVIRNVEVNGEYKPRRFSTWAPKAIATIRALADTLEDRSIVVQLQRKPKTAKVERVRQRDNSEFRELRSKAARWAADHFALLSDPDPTIPDSLSDRAADNWRPLLAIAELAGIDWAMRAREAARKLSGSDGGDTAVNVQLLSDIKEALGDLDVIRSADLVGRLAADLEKPWAEWRHGKPLTQKQLGGLLRPFGIVSETVSIPGLADAKGYKRVRFEQAWEAYPSGQNTFVAPSDPSEASKRRNADGTGTSSDSRSVTEPIGDGSKNANLSYSHAGSDASTLRKAENGARTRFDQESEIEPARPLDELEASPVSAATPEKTPTNGHGKPSDGVPSEGVPGFLTSDGDQENGPYVVSLRSSPDDDMPRFLQRCAQCNTPGDGRGAVFEHKAGDRQVWLHKACCPHWEKARNGIRAAKGTAP